MDRNMQVTFCMKVALKFWGSEIWVSSAFDIKVAKLQHDFSWVSQKIFFSTHWNKEILVLNLLNLTDYDGDIPALILEKYFLMVNFDTL